MYREVQAQGKLFCDLFWDRFFFFFLTFSLIILAQGNLLMKFPDDTKLEGTVKTEKDKDVT